MKYPSTFKIIVFLCLAALGGRSKGETKVSQEPAPPILKKVNDLIIYKDDRFYCAFPSIVQRADGELIVAFRRAPERRNWGALGYTHTGPNSYLVLGRA